MNNPYKFALVGAAVLAPCCGGFWYRGQPPALPAALGRQPKILYWHDPMHPAYRSGKPGIAPDCGMRLDTCLCDSGTEWRPRPSFRARSQIAPKSATGYGHPSGLGGAPLVHPAHPPLGRVVVGRSSNLRIFGAGEGWVRENLALRPRQRCQKDDLLGSNFIPRRSRTPLMRISTRSAPATGSPAAK